MGVDAGGEREGLVKKSERNKMELEFSAYGKNKGKKRTIYPFIVSPVNLYKLVNEELHKHLEQRATEILPKP